MSTYRPWLPEALIHLTKAVKLNKIISTDRRALLR
jgi:hypothetical protein